MSDNSKLKLGALTALVVGSMIGGGIFSLPQNMASGAGAGATLIGWAITAVGMLMLAFVFQNLALHKPELDNGVYAYAKAGFGNYLGFSSAWGYWISAWIGNVSYLVLLFGTLGYFFPILGEGNTPIAIVCASILLWLVHLLVLRGIKEAAFINLVTTIAKIVPLLTFIVLVGLAFKADVFNTDFWGNADANLGSVTNQVKSMMLVTVWVFIGIEGASVYSARAEKRSDVGKATVMGFFGVLALLVLVNVLSLGVMSRPELAELKNPSMASVLQHVVGSWGAAFISIGLIISLTGALLSWVLLSGEILFSAAKDHTMPNFFGKENKNGVPANALWVSNGAIQLFLIITLFSSSSYLQLLYLATSMILMPYFFSTAYAVKLALTGDGYETDSRHKTRDLVIGVVAMVYSMWLLYAAGAKYLLLSALLYAPGAIVYYIARRENNKLVFTNIEKVYFALSVIGAIVAAIGLFNGSLEL
ncbi:MULTISPECIES: arginine-ornithine antiporter [unclassified Moraxella]|uniref:arginine-ornithine antiporter n=1 Tax=unclassified Moraxella TaxID=2685852 RepID=UPI003AF689FB